MSRLALTHHVDQAGLERILSPRDDLVRERALDDGRFGLDHGPFAFYERTVEVAEPQPSSFVVTETIRFRMAPHTWAFLFGPVYRLGLRRRHDRRSPWWAPPDRLDARAGSVLGVLCTVSLVGGYLGTLLTQTLTFAADELGASESTQGDLVAAVRVGALLSIVFTTLADRRGRRLLLVVTGLVAVAATAAGALAPGMAALAATQTVARGATTALAILILIVAAEEMPAGSRAYAVSLLAMTGALGAGMCLWVLPIADVDLRAWRLLYVLPLLGIPLLLWVGRALPETRRFTAPHVAAPMAGHGRRFWLLASGGFLLALFTTPASAFQNEFLRDERGYSAGALSLFIMATSTPAAIGIVVGGHLADVRGRRVVGAVSVLTGVGATLVMFFASGWPMWAWSVVASVLGAATVPALSVYLPELFPTSLRGRANGIITLISVGGSVIGLVVVGRLAESFDRFGPALAIVAVGPLLMAVLVLVAFPETAHVELEELNPEDQVPGYDRPPCPPANSELPSR